MNIPWRARLPWFAIWVPVALLLYTLVNGAGHVQVAYHALNVRASPEADLAIDVAACLCGPLGFLTIPALGIFACVSWRLCPQVSPLVRWMAGMLGLLLCTLFLLTQVVLLCPFGWRAGLPPAWQLRICAVQLWKPHLCRPVLEPFKGDSSAWKAQASDLIALLKNENAGVRYWATSTLGQLGAKECAPIVASLLKDEDDRVRGSAANALGQVGAKEHAPGIAANLKDQNPDVRGCAADALGNLGAKEYAPAIASLLKDGDAAVRLTAVDALGRLGAKEYTPAIVGLLKDREAMVRGYSVQSLNRLRAKEYTSVIAILLQDKDIQVRRFATIALGELGAKEYIPAIASLLKDRNAVLRLYAVEALRRLGAKECAPDIASLLKDEAANVRYLAARALGSLTGQDFPQNEAGVCAAQAWWAQHKNDPEFQGAHP